MLALTHFLPLLPLSLSPTANYFALSFSILCLLLPSLYYSIWSLTTAHCLPNALGRAALQHCFVVPPPLVATSLAPMLHVISFIYCSAGICWPFFCCPPNLAMKRFMATSSCCRAARLLWLICHYNYLCPRYYIHTRNTERARRRHNMPHYSLATSPAVRHIYRFALRLHFYDESSWLYLRTIWFYQW